MVHKNNLVEKISLVPSCQNSSKSMFSPKFTQISQSGSPEPASFKKKCIDAQVMFVTGPKSLLCIIEFLNIKNTDEYDYLKHCQHRTTIFTSTWPTIVTHPAYSKWRQHFVERYRIRGRQSSWCKHWWPFWQIKNGFHK